MLFTLDHNTLLAKAGKKCADTMLLPIGGFANIIKVRTLVPRQQGDDFRRFSWWF